MRHVNKTAHCIHMLSLQDNNADVAAEGGTAIALRVLVSQSCAISIVRLIAMSFQMLCSINARVVLLVHQCHFDACQRPHSMQLSSPAGESIWYGSRQS